VSDYPNYLHAIKLAPPRRPRRRWFGPFIMSVMLEGPGEVRPIVWLTCEEVT
jgi:hypothetical protein